jgi:RNA polymerase sigma-70 factor (ECF subfamily)
MTAWRWITDRARAGKGGAMAAARRSGADAPPPSVDPWRRELAEVYRVHASFVQRCAGHLGVLDHHLDDVVHDVFLVVYRRLPELDPARGSLRSWLFGITKRVVLHHRRAAARHQRRLTIVPTPALQPCPAEELARRRAVDHIECFLQGLPPKQRIVFALADVEGMPAVEVARSLETNVNTIYARLAAARRAFARYLDELERDREDDDAQT